MSELHQQESEFSRLLQQLSFDDVPRPEHGEVLREQVLAMFDQTRASQATVQLPQRPVHTWREVMRRPIPRLIAMAVACLAIAAPWLLFPGNHSTVFAFHNFAAALVEAKTARFQMEVTREGFPSQQVKGYYLAPAKFRGEMSFLGVGAVSISDDLTGKIVMLMPLVKTATVMTSKGRPKDQPSNDPFFRLQDLLSKSRGATDNPFQPIGDKEIDGKRATGFRSESAIGQFTLWGDPETGHPIRVEATWSGTPRIEVVMSQFEINVDLDESLFDMTPPADYKVVAGEIDVSQPEEPDLVNAFKVWGDISGGEFPGSLDFLAPISLMGKYWKARFKDQQTPTTEEMQQYQKEFAPIQRGFRFALELPESADAYYAGKGVKQGTVDKPIFWYRSGRSTKYRVIFADLSVKEADAAPDVSGAKRLFKASKTSTPTEK